MVEFNIISENKLRYLSGEKGFNLIYLEKDYFLTLLLYLLKDVEGICFKGGTALNKIFLNHTRLSEDLDFACQKGISAIKNQIVKILENNKNIFPKHGFENVTTDFFRLKIFYNGFFSKSNYVILDINRKASVILRPEKQNIPHFYLEIPTFSILTLDIRELVAEKVRTLLTRNQPRDYFDVYNLLKSGYKIDLKLVGQKMKEVRQPLEIGRIFKPAQKVYSRWEQEMQLTNRPVGFVTVIRRLQKEFKYKTPLHSKEISTSGPS